MPLEFAWHLHHDVMVEALTEPIEVRAAFIEKYKPSEEVPLRLRLLKKVQGALPAEVVQAEEARDQAREACAQAREACVQTGEARDQAREACVQTGEARDQGEAYFQAREARDQGEAYDQASKAYFQAREAYNRAGGACVQARDACTPAIAALHAQECPDCPWDGRTIFTRKDEDGKWY